MQQEVLARAGEDTGVLVIWVNMLRFDGEKAVSKARRILDDPRVEHFWDPKNRVPEILGGAFGWRKNDPAWDMYLYYPSDASWGEVPPRPLAYFHQLSKHQDDEGHFFVGADLNARLKEATEKYLSSAAAVVQ